MTRQTQTPIFVVSSGRAGSTLLARMIHRHPQLLCVSDLFEPVGEVPYFDHRKIVDGEEKESISHEIDHVKRFSTAR